MPGISKAMSPVAVLELEAAPAGVLKRVLTVECSGDKSTVDVGLEASRKLIELPGGESVVKLELVDLGEGDGEISAKVSGSFDASSAFVFDIDSWTTRS